MARSSFAPAVATPPVWTPCPKGCTQSVRSVSAPESSTGQDSPLPGLSSYNHSALHPSPVRAHRTANATRRPLTLPLPSPYPYSNPIHIPAPTLSLALPGLDIRTELKGVFFISFRSQFVCFHFSVPPGQCGFGQFWPKNTCFGRIWPRKVVLVNSGQKNWFFDWKNWFRSILAEKYGVRRFWPEKLGFDRKH